MSINNHSFQAWHKNGTWSGQGSLFYLLIQYGFMAVIFVQDNGPSGKVEWSNEGHMI